MSAVQHAVREDSQIFGSREQAGVPGNSAKNACIFVLHLPLNDAMAEAEIVSGWQDGILQGLCGIKCRMHHAERAKDFALAESVERFVGQTFEDDTENDEADVTVFDP